MAIKYLDMFAGIGGFRSGLERIGGFECIGYCEIDKYAKQSYEAMYDTKGELYFNDARKINPKELPDIDLITGGFPCQSFSIAGRRKGFEDTRGTLFFEIARIASAKKPKYLFLENVPGLLNHDRGRTFKTILSSLDELGYDVTWQVLNSKDFGVPQSRKRLYIVGFFRAKCAGQILSFKEANSKTTIQIYPGKEGERIYSSEGESITLTSNGGSFGGRTGLYSIEEFGIPIKVKTKSGYQIAYPGDSIDVGYSGTNTRRGRVGHNVAHTLTTSSTQACYFIDMNPEPKMTEVARCITARHASDISNRKGEHSAVFLEKFQITDDEEHPMVVFVDKDKKVHIGKIRKLTPRECWRLQGFTDEQFDKVIATGMSDTQLYKQAGNAVTVNVISAVGQIIKEVEKQTE
ncbi:MAG: DNA (cytosine-5-)-methyltransferase [Oscillospiraceae bacterium]|nr:DNA (cytosine-5-)-methyltransferase [Oscillospiraceae bacterium]